MLYFIHFIGLWIIIALLIGLTDIIPSIVIWSVFLGFQIGFFILNVFKIYEEIGLRVISILNEALLLGVCVYSIVD